MIATDLLMTKADLIFDPDHEFLRDLFPWEVTKNKGGRVETIEGWLFASEVVAYLMWGKTYPAAERGAEDGDFPYQLLWWLGETGQLRDWSGPLWSVAIADESLVQEAMNNGGFGRLTLADFVEGRVGTENVLCRESERRPPSPERFVKKQILPGISRLESRSKPANTTERRAGRYTPPKTAA